MKSERAYNQIYIDGIIDKKGSPPYSIFEQYEVVQIVELAEQDARERAVKARIASCPYLYTNGTCAGSYEDCIGKECPQVKSFLKTYDHEA